jgi:hypothetical protein
VLVGYILSINFLFALYLVTRIGWSIVDTSKVLLISIAGSLSLFWIGLKLGQRFKTRRE